MKSRRRNIWTAAVLFIILIGGLCLAANASAADCSGQANPVIWGCVNFMGGTAAQEGLGTFVYLKQIMLGQSTSALNPDVIYAIDPNDANNASICSGQGYYAFSNASIQPGKSYVVSVDGMGSQLQYPPFVVQVDANCAATVSGSPITILTFNEIINGSCGSSNGQTFSSKPSTNLCSAAGTQPTVTGTGPWSWTCAGLNGGTAAGCFANVAFTNGSCGSSNGQALSAAPSPATLCTAGSATTVTGSGPWTWSCQGTGGGTSANCTGLLPTCGAANGQAYSSTNPPTNTSPSLCGAGSVLGGSGVTAITGGWTWKCKSQDKLLAVTCNATQGTPTPINGDCGTANGATLSSAPTSGLCSVGTATTVNGTGPWTWTCQGSNGGNNDSCTAYTSSSTGYQGTYLAMNSNPTFDNLGGGQTRLYYFTLPANCGGNGQLRIATNQQQSAPHVAAVVKKTNGSNTTPPPTMADYNTLLTLWGPTNAGTKSQDGIYFTAFNFGSPTGETITIGTAAADKNKTWYTPDWQQFDTYYVLLVNTTSTVTAGWINAYCY